MKKTEKLSYWQEKLEENLNALWTGASSCTRAVRL